MAGSEPVIEVSEATFESAVMLQSRETPGVVDFGRRGVGSARCWGRSWKTGAGRAGRFHPRQGERCLSCWARRTRSHGAIGVSWPRCCISKRPLDARNKRGLGLAALLF